MAAKRHHSSHAKRHAKHNEHMQGSPRNGYQGSGVTYEGDSMPSRNYREAEMMYKDGAMIREDWSKPALLPQGTMNKDWPRCDYGLKDIRVPDLFDQVNHQMDRESEKMREERSHRKY